MTNIRQCLCFYFFSLCVFSSADGGVWGAGSPAEGCGQFQPNPQPGPLPIRALCLPANPRRRDRGQLLCPQVQWVFFCSYSVLFSVEDIRILNKTRSEWTSNSNKNMSHWTTEVMGWNCPILAPVKCASVSFEMFWPCLSVDISHHTQPQQSFVRTINTSQTQVRSYSHSEYFQTFLSSLWTLAVG